MATETLTLLTASKRCTARTTNKHLIILPITLVFGSSHAVPRGTSSSRRPGLRAEVTGRRVEFQQGEV
ncbi:hypothetical protein NQZ68_008859 [Dissostichus eleginoides]|nr:hypothetical protein NQZ68_008859 [Dissostichus eleginoides]